MRIDQGLGPNMRALLIRVANLIAVTSGGGNKVGIHQRLVEFQQATVQIRKMIKGVRDASGGLEHVSDEVIAGELLDRAKEHADSKRRASK